MRLLPSLAACCLLASCAPLPDTTGRPPSHAVRETAATGLGRAVRSFTSAHRRESGFHPLENGADAFAARIGVASMAERSLDVQYYIWHSDLTGKRLIARLLAAADRGVRVRVLVDDFGTPAKDYRLLALDSHPGIEVRLFNPVMTRSARLLGTVVDFGRVNRRMHNKAFIADNQVAIVGGRNIGDEYFDAHGKVNFADFDVVAVGPVVREVSQSFDAYWNCPSAIGITQLTPKRPTPEHKEELRTVLAAAGPGGDAFAAKLRRRDVRFIPARATVVADDPAKVLASARRTETHLAPKLRGWVGVPRGEMLIVSPYLIPGKDGVADMISLRRSGVRVVVLTNSLAATDVPAVHAGYQRYRKDLLRAGVELYENKPSGGWDLAGGVDGPPGKDKGTSRSSLHAKTFTFDRRSMFVGSMNLDPRSILLNTEIGIQIECRELAGKFTDVILGGLEHNAYRVVSEGSRLVWITTENGKAVRFTTEPLTTAWQRFAVGVLSWLPLEGQF